MTIEEQLKQEILSKYKSVRAFTTSIQVPYTTLDSVFKRGVSNAGIETMLKVFGALDLDIESIKDGTLRHREHSLSTVKKEAPSDLSEEALKVAKDYSALDRHGKNMTKIVITEEQKRMVEERQRRESGEEEPRYTRIIPLYYTPAAAGMTSPAAGQDFDYIEINKEAPKNADFAVKIDGDSMEPYIMDGTIVYVNREPLANGDVGIFFVDGDMLCKQYYKDERGNIRLLSLNRSRSDADRFISSNDSDTVMMYYGRVILPRRPAISWA